jgi:hypothetical protein
MRLVRPRINPMSSKNGMADDFAPVADVTSASLPSARSASAAIAAV